MATITGYPHRPRKRRRKLRGTDDMTLLSVPLTSRIFASCEDFLCGFVFSDGMEMRLTLAHLWRFLCVHSFADFAPLRQMPLLWLRLCRAGKSVPLVVSAALLRGGNLEGNAL